jgi:hypothetical protein
MSYTPEKLESTLDQFDDKVKTGILSGDLLLDALTGSIGPTLRLPAHA